MKNDKVIVLNGLNRGGTNIVWNILQSHPRVCSSIRETGQALYCRGTNPLVGEALGRFLRSRRVVDSDRLRNFCGRLIDDRLFRLKLENLKGENAFEFEGVAYTEEKVRDSVLCLKSSTTDLDLTELLARIYERIFFIGLIRNGYGVCAAWLRGKRRTPREVGRIYRHYGEKMIEDRDRFPRYKIIRFEDVVADPFRMASELYGFAELEPTLLEKLRLKSKRFLPTDDGLTTSFGEVDRKYWLGPQEIRRFIVPDASEIEARQLSPADRKAFEAQARPVLDHFGYKPPADEPA